MIRKLPLPRYLHSVFMPAEMAGMGSPSQNPDHQQDDDHSQDVDPFRREVVDILSTTDALSEERWAALVQLGSDVIDRSAFLQCCEKWVAELLARVQVQVVAAANVQTAASPTLENVLSLLVQLVDLQEGEDLADKLLLLENLDAVFEFTEIERAVFQLAKAAAPAGTEPNNDSRADVALLFRLVAAVLAVVYARGRHALDAVGLDRSISNLDAALARRRLSPTLLPDGATAPGRRSANSDPHSQDRDGRRPVGHGEHVVWHLFRPPAGATTNPTNPSSNCTCPRCRGRRGCGAMPARYSGTRPPRPHSPRCRMPDSCLPAPLVARLTAQIP